MTKALVCPFLQASERARDAATQPPGRGGISTEALGMPGRVISLVVQALMLIGVCTIFLVLTGINAEQLEEKLGL